jgi:hypothetical protein
MTSFAPLSPEFEPLFRVECEVGAIETLGPMAMGERRVVAITGGRIVPAVAGSALAGRILPGGADWQWVRADGITEIAAHYVVQADTGDRIEVESTGLRHGPPAVMQRLGRGEPVDPREYYFRTAVRFRTGAAHPELARLNGLMAIALGERRAAQVLLGIYALK